MYGAMCIWTKNRKCTLAYIILSIQIFKKKKKTKKNYTAKIGESPNFDVWFFEILLIPRQKANTSHSLIIKYSHYGGGFNCLFSSPPLLKLAAVRGFQRAAAVSHLSQDPGKLINELEGCSWLQGEGE